MWLCVIFRTEAYLVHGLHYRYRQQHTEDHKLQIFSTASPLTIENIPQFCVIRKFHRRVTILCVQVQNEEYERRSVCQKCHYSLSPA